VGEGCSGRARHPRGGMLNYLDRTEVRPTPVTRSLANLKREISEEKWMEARRWAGGRTSKKKYKMPESHKPDGAVAESTMRLASRYYQLKAGHARTGHYLYWAKVRPKPKKKQHRFSENPISCTKHARTRPKKIPRFRFTPRLN